MLGKNIKDYLLSSFFADELSTLNLFRFLPKTPFIWHLSSGDQHGFDVYTIIYRWNRDKILKIKSYYIDKRKAGINNRLSNLSADDSAAAEKEKDSLRKQLNEIKDFENKLDDLLTSGYDPELDDGVGKNIAPLQDLGLLADDVLTKSQLKKFLNADW
jgi:glycosidase